MNLWQIRNEAYELFMKGNLVDLENWRGNTPEGIHTACCGAVWQAVIFGFAGLRVTEDGYTIESPARSVDTPGFFLPSQRQERTGRTPPVENPCAMASIYWATSRYPADALLETARIVSFDAMVMASDVIMAEMRRESHVKQHVRGLLLRRLCDVTRNTSSFRAVD